ncbi:hypothetical protein OROMI_004237 [Orobanche minor]
MMKTLYEQSLRLSTSALEHYNKKHHVDFELVEPLVSSPIVGGDGIWFHCNYKAKDRAVSGEESDGSSMKLFFSELKVVKPSNLKKGISARYKVTACRIIDEVLNKSQVVITAVVKLFIPLAGSERGFTTVIRSVFLLYVPS